MTIKTKNTGIDQTLVLQLDKAARHNWQGSFRTKERYYEAMKQFCRFLADHYGNRKASAPGKCRHHQRQRRQDPHGANQ